MLIEQMKKVEKIEKEIEIEREREKTPEIILLEKFQVQPMSMRMRTMEVLETRLGRM